MRFEKKIKHIFKRLIKLPNALWKTPQTKENLDILKSQIINLTNQLEQMEEKNLRMVDAIGSMIFGMNNSLDNLSNHLHEVKEYKDKVTCVDRNLKSLDIDLSNIKIQNKDIRDRIEFIRKEIFFELQMNLRKLKVDFQNSSQHKKFKILNEDKLKNASNLHLNVGCGHLIKEDFINIDNRELPNIDIVADAGSLEFEKNSISTIYASHLIEHFTLYELTDSILPHWFSLLKEDGKLIVLAPDAQAMINAYYMGEIPYDDFREVMYGSQEYDGDFHFNMLTSESTIELLKQVGFSKVDLIAEGRRNGLCFEFEIHATK